MTSGERLKAVLSRKIQFTGARTGEFNELGYCPFHKGGTEVNPSFAVYVGPSTDKCEFGTAHCFTCAKSWPLRVLVEKLDIPVTGLGDLLNYAEHVKNRRNTAFCFDNPKLPHSMLGLYEWCPVSLLNAGFTEGTLREYDIGFDMSTLRITYPLFDHYGNLVGISGRTLRGNTPRYKIYTGELGIPGYNLQKDRLLWGLQKFYMRAVTMGLSEPVVLCEGFKATMWLKQHMVKYPCCALGTSLSDEQVELLRRCTSDVILFLDDDKPGRDATARHLRKIMRGNINVSIARYPAEKRLASPDDLSPVEVASAIREAMGIYEWTQSQEV